MLTQRRRRHVAALLTFVLAIASGVAGNVSVAQAASVPATKYAPIAFGSDMPSPNFMLTDTSGGVTVGCSSPEGSQAFKTFEVDGDVVQSRATATNLYTGTYYSPCVRTMAVGADGTLFVLAVTANFTVAMIKAIKNNVEQWSYTLPCNARSVQGMVVGVDGNVYMTITANQSYQWPCSNWRLLGLSATAPTGTTTPTVLVDEAFSVSGFVLEGGISAYEGGLAVRTTEGVKYFEYDGDVIDSFDITNVLNGTYKEYDDIDLAGRVVVPVRADASVIQQCNSDSWVAGTLKAYGPSGHQWTYSLDNCARVYEVRPSPHGVVVHYSAPDDGVYGNTVRRYLFALDTNGVPQWKVVVSPDGSDVIERFLMFAVDLNGNVALMQQFTKTVQSQWGTYHYPEFHLKLLSGTSGNSVGTYSFVGDQVGANGNGYRWVGNGYPSIARGVWYVPLKSCWHWSSCTDSTASLYAVSAPGLEMDYPRGAILGQNGAKTVPMAAAGDSFSSGLGALAQGRSYDGGSCSRSSSAYGHLLGDDLGVKLRLPKSAFTACAGATSGQMLGAGQVNSIPTSAKSVFLTAGGNDVKFARLGALCIFIDCATSGYEDEFGIYLDALDGDLAALYEAIATRAPDAEVYVLKYPRLYPVTNCSGTQWFNTLNGVRLLDASYYEGKAVEAGLDQLEADTASATTPAITTSEVAWTSGFLDDLNAEIEDAVFAANVLHGGRFHIVETNALGSPFYGHELCTNEPYFNGLDLAAPGSTFHPNIAGQWAMYELAREALEVHQPEYVLS